MKVEKVSKSVRARRTTARIAIDFKRCAKFHKASFRLRRIQYCRVSCSSMPRFSMSMRLHSTRLHEMSIVLFPKFDRSLATLELQWKPDNRNSYCERFLVWFIPEGIPFRLRWAVQCDACRQQATRWRQDRVAACRAQDADETTSGRRSWGHWRFCPLPRWRSSFYGALNSLFLYSCSDETFVFKYTL